MTFATILTAAEIEAYHARTAKLDRAFAASSKKWWQGKTANELKTQAAYAWNCSDREGYVLARSYLAQLERAA